MATRTVKKPKPDRPRIVIRVALDLKRDQDWAAVSEIDKLKNSRQFKPTFLDGLRLMLDLRDGRTDVLRELFPWVLEQQPVITEDDEIKLSLARLERQLADMRAAGNQIAAPSQPTRLLAPPKPLEDDLPELTIVEATSNENPTFNMILSTMSIGAKPENIPREILEYGIAMGRVPASALVEHDLVRGKTAKPEEPPKKDPKQIAGAAKEFEPPNFDDDDLMGLLD